MRSNCIRALCLVAVPQTTMAQSWTQVASGTPLLPLSESALAYDSTRGRTVLCGGGLTFEWDGGAWTPHLSNGPTLRTGYGLIYDSHRGRTLLFGGHASSGTWCADTWEWDGGAWLPQIFASGPVARGFHIMAYDSARDRTLLFGGMDGFSFFGDTWEWNGSTWTQVAATGPSLRAYHVAAYDSQRGRTVLFGGGNSSGILGDTWEWDGVTWIQVATTGPSPRASAAMVYDGHRAVLFGGQDSTGYFGDTWEWAGGTWTLATTAGPGPRSGHGMAYDSQRDRVVLFGGIFGGRDTWERNGGFTSTATRFGSGCGTPALDLAPVASARPILNATAQASLSNIPLSLAFVALGWSRSSFGAFSLPLTLAGFGMPSCDLLQSSEAPAQPVAFVATGTATYSLAVPNSSVLVGVHVYLQGWAVASGANASNVIVSNGVEWGIGNS